MAGGIFQGNRVIGAFNGRLFFSCFIIMLSQINFGMDTSAFNNTQAMTPFERKFGVYQPALKRIAIEPYFLSLLNSLPTLGQVSGLLLGSFVCRRFGRRMSFFTMCFFAWIAAILLITAQAKEQVLVGRMLNFVYVGMELASVPVTQSELAPAAVRGFVVGTYQLGIMVGGLIMALICLGTSKIPNENSYRIPFGTLFIIPTILFIGTFWIPESPRWLLLKGRDKQARHNLQLLRQGAFTDEQIEEEFQILKGTLELTAETGSFKEIWQGTNLKRTLIVLGTNFFLQATGQVFGSKYGTVFLKDIGAIDPFVMSTVNTVCAIAAVLLCMGINDKVGRKSLMMIGTCIQGGALVAMGGLGSVANPSREYKIGITAMTVVLNAAYCFGWAPLSHVITAEIPTTRLRDITYATGSVVNIAVAFSITFSLPYLLYAPYAALGPKVGFIFGSFALLAIFFAWFCIPETGGLTLEELDYLFLQDVPVRKFSSYKHGQVLPSEIAETSAKEPQVSQHEVA